MKEPSSEVDELAHQVIGAAIEVHRLLGAGFLESVYEQALAIEFLERGISFVRQAPIALEYKGQNVGEARLDFLVGGILVVELKAVEAIHPIHQAQVINYLKATGHTLGLPINFNVLKLKDGGIKRIVST
ncbi:GxxExxY protein [Aeoliella sp. ICT_H6.2]|uniref:GxxExxY protein n=1 Tax=Aeoliella straminimaris TaxID=2954799 RepID=A0A9X2F8C0_9BACT|nr:GxxExxY protein [Aeoliella straminimaris]MCO6043704.1 GxxExxY protein [Aeoliella straminimaris]